MVMETKLNRQVDTLTSRFNHLELKLHENRQQWKAALEKECEERNTGIDALRTATTKLADEIHDLEQTRRVSGPPSSHTRVSWSGGSRTISLIYRWADAPPRSRPRRGLCTCKAPSRRYLHTLGVNIFDRFNHTEDCGVLKMR